MNRWLEIMALFAVVSAAACELGGTPTSGGTGGAAGEGGATSSSTGSGGNGGSSACDGRSACGACVQCALDDPCAAQAGACDGNPDCFALSACHFNCGGNNPACESDCAAVYPGGAVDFDALLGCLAASCPMSCGAGGG